MLYSVLGAYIFMEVEGPAERKRRAGLLRERLYLGDLLWNLTLNYDGDPQSYNNWTQYVNEQLPRYEEKIYQAYKYSMSSDTEVWDFYGALLYCGTIYTTIGYGHVAPSTDWGRIATMIYGTIGVPLALIVLADMGRHFTILLKVLWVLARKSCEVGACLCRVSATAAATAGGAMVNAGRRGISRDRSPPYKITDRFDNEEGDAPIARYEDSRTPISDITEEDDYDERNGAMFGSDFLRIGGNGPTLADIDDQFNLPMGIAAIILVVYIFLGTLMFKSWEEWGYLEAFYFVFISLSTIGLGDIVPAHSKFFLLSSIYIFFGLSLVSMCINVAVQFFSRTMKKARETMNVISDRAQRTATMTIGKAKTAVVKITGDADGSVTHDLHNGVSGDPDFVGVTPTDDDPKHKEVTEDTAAGTEKDTKTKQAGQGFPYQNPPNDDKICTGAQNGDTVVNVAESENGFTG
ncbi:family of potassium channels 18-like isoform X2 [Argonauta hians]